MPLASAALEGVDERLGVEAGSAAAEVLEAQCLEGDAVGLTVEREGLDDSVLGDLVKEPWKPYSSPSRPATYRQRPPVVASQSRILVSIPFGPTQRANNAGSV